jgi:cyclopropane-fatty-acyl-phospholipid synthase
MEFTHVPQARGVWLDRLARKLFVQLVQQITTGQLVLVDGAERLPCGAPTADFPLTATLTIHAPRFYRRVVFGGNIGGGAAYMDGDWTADDLPAVIRIILRNRAAFKGLERRWTWLTAPAARWFHALRRDTRAGSRDNIAAHYDLGNDLYQLFLDDTMTYSCGIFATAETSLAASSIAKYDRLCKKLRLAPQDHVLEIGTGWGGFALHAAQHYGCRITTTTISQQQHDFARERFQQAGVADRITLLCEDYRDLRGTFDKLVSIEMIEAVGHHYFETYLRVCSERLKPDGVAAIQAITMADYDFEEHKRSVDFIKRYIFPGSCIPSVAALYAAAARVTDLRLVHLEDITPHYARTLRLWRTRFCENLPAVRQLGYDDRFIRMWEYYLAYCEAGFAERYLGDVHLLFAKPLCRLDPILPPLI